MARIVWVVADGGTSEIPLARTKSSSPGRGQRSASSSLGESADARIARLEAADVDQHAAQLDRPLFAATPSSGRTRMVWSSALS
jgi:hypothetical protein